MMNAIYIGPLKFDRPVFMAPMEGITDVPFRKIVRKRGCGVTCTQMIHAEALLRHHQRRVAETSAIVEEEKPVGLQLCAPEPGVIGEAAKIAENLGAAFIDINMGCPAKNVVGNGAGAALLQNPAKAGAIVREVVKNVSIPVTVKIRAGWDSEYRNALEIGSILEQEGAKLISVHARTRAQKFKDKADWNLIRAVKDKLKIPVVGNGDVFASHDVSAMLKDTGADGVMVARGALGNPWIFGDHRPTIGDIYKTMMEHLDFHLAFYSDRDRSLVTFRKHIVWYTKGIPNAAEFRVRLFKIKDYDVVLKMIRDFFEPLDPQTYPHNSVSSETDAN
jgi:tRNA-dihydrouridine synthase B